MGRGGPLFIRIPDRLGCGNVTGEVTFTATNPMGVWHVAFCGPSRHATTPIYFRRRFRWGDRTEEIIIGLVDRQLTSLEVTAWFAFYQRVVAYCLVNLD